MPEQITRYPDVTIQVLKGAGAKCGVGAQQKILTRCPRDRFCALPTGEMCVFGLDEVPRMTQVTVQQIADLYCKPAPKKSGLVDLDPAHGGLLLAGLVFGFVVGRVRRWRRRPGGR